MSSRDVSRGLRLFAPRKAVLVDLDVREPMPHEVIVSVRVSAISIGSAMALYEGLVRPSAYPAALGYEAVGTVIARGAAVVDRHVGERVVVTAGHDDCVTVDASRTVPVPGDVSDAAALLLVLACDADTGILRTNVPAGASIVVTGAGAMGLLTTFGLLRREFTVDVVEPRPTRRDLALVFGARSAVSPEQASGWRDSSYQVGFECSDAGEAFLELQRLIARRGAIGVIADGNHGPLVLGPHFHDKELSVLGCSDLPRYHELAPEYFDVIRTGWAERLERLFDHRAALAELPELFEAMARAPEERPLKVLVTHGSEGTP